MSSTCGEEAAAEHAGEDHRGGGRDPLSTESASCLSTAATIERRASGGAHDGADGGAVGRAAPALDVVGASRSEAARTPSRRADAM